MKGLVVILGVCAICALPLSVAQADESITPTQEIKNEQSYATLNLQKQPQEGKQKQGITNHFTFFTINVQINGKIKDSADSVDR